MSNVANPAPCLEELLPTAALRERWVSLLSQRRAAYKANDDKDRSLHADYDFGAGFLHALWVAELLSAEDSARLLELLLKPDGPREWDGQTEGQP